MTICSRPNCRNSSTFRQRKMTVTISVRRTILNSRPTFKRRGMPKKKPARPTTCRSSRRFRNHYQGRMSYTEPVEIPLTLTDSIYRDSYFHAFDNEPDPLANLASGRAANIHNDPDQRRILDELMKTAQEGNREDIF